MKNKIHKFVFGIFKERKLIFALNTTRCTHPVATSIVELFEKTKEYLQDGEYFAYDYYGKDKTDAEAS